MVVCLITIHGIGFQTAPEDGLPGYADDLHELLGTHLEAPLLGDDPGRKNERSRRGQAGPIYVQSHWPPESRATEPGLARLGTWLSRDLRKVDHSQAPLVDPEDPAQIAHIALVYSHLEDQGSHSGAAIIAAAEAIGSVAHYASVAGLAHLALQDGIALLQRHPSSSDGPSAGFQQRDPRGGATGLASVVGTVEADVTTYVARNDLRVRVQDFVREALMLLASRDDVDKIVINSHSQGTVLAYDVLRNLPLFAGEMVCAYVTAGSPLRKYATLFDWGTDVGALASIGPWTNFFDPRDPVANPLTPPASWRAGDELTGPWTDSLFHAIDSSTGTSTTMAIADQQVDNITNSPPGGLQAHDYWHNDPEFVQPLAMLLRNTLKSA